MNVLSAAEFLPIRSTDKRQHAADPKIDQSHESHESQQRAGHQRHLVHFDRAGRDRVTLLHHIAGPARHCGQVSRRGLVCIGAGFGVYRLVCTTTHDKQIDTAFAINI